MSVSIAAAQSAKPATIPCVPSLPCIQEETQKKGGGEVQYYVLNDWGSRFLQGFLGLCAITAVVFIIVGGMQMHLAVGNDEALGKAKKTVTWAIIGLVVSILSVAIVQIIINLPIK